MAQNILFGNFVRSKKISAEFVVTIGLKHSKEINKIFDILNNFYLLKSHSLDFDRYLRYEKEVENEEYKRLLEEEIKADEDLVKSILDEEQLNTLKYAYVNNIAEKVKSNWRYQGAEDDWTAEVYVVQDRDGTVVAVDVRNANVDDSSIAKVFKDSIRRAVYKASPLPLAPSDEVFNKELIFKFGVSP